MDLYHSRLTQDDLKDLIIKYKIPRDLHPRLPFEEFVMSKLSDDAIGIYHRMIDIFGVRIPFSSFLLALIKHYRVHFSQLVPLGLNKGDWFYFAKRRAPSLICIDDNHSCMKHWKSSFFLIDRRAIPDSIVWRHPSAAIDDPRPAVGSFNMADVRRLSAYVIKLRDMPEGVLVLSGLSRLWRLPFYYTHPTAVNDVILDPTPEDLAVGTPSAKIFAKAEASQKQKASTSGATSSHVAKHASDDDDDDACVEISLVTPIRSTAVIPSSGKQGGSSVAPTAEGPGTRDSRGKGIMVDDVVAPPVGVSPPRPSSGPASSFRDVSEDAIHTYFFPFSAGPYYAAYPEGGVADNCEFTSEEWDAPYRPNFGVLTKEVFKDLVVYKTVCVALHDMSHGGELLARYRGLWLQRHVAGLSDKLSYSDVAFAKSKAKGKERKKKIKSLTKSLDQLNVEVTRLSTALNQTIVPEAEKDEEILRLKATPPKFASFFRGQFQGLVLKFLASDEFSRVQGELLSLAASAGFECGLSMHRTKDDFVVVLNKMAHFMPVHRPEKLAHPANVLTSRDSRVSPPIVKELIVTPASESLELPANVFPTSSVVALEQNEEWGTSHVLDDVAEVTANGSKRVFSSPTDVVVALSVGEKGDGSLLSSAADEEAAANPSRV
ncbi:hypothetical protein Tco_0223745 [Tanacetum coccineum]